MAPLALPQLEAFLAQTDKNEDEVVTEVLLANEATCWVVVGLNECSVQFGKEIQASARGEAVTELEKGTTWADYQVLSLPNIPSVLHVFQTNGNSQLGNLISGGVSDERSSSKLNNWLQPDTNESDSALRAIRPPSSALALEKAGVIAVVSLAEAGQVLETVDTLIDFAAALLSPILRAVTTSEQREALKEKARSPFDSATLNAWRTDTGVEGQIEKVTFDPPLAVPLIIVVTRGELTTDLRERRFRGERELIEASLAKKAASLGATLVFSDVGRRNDSKEPPRNFGVLKCLLDAMFLPSSVGSLPPPILPEALGYPAGDSEKLVWIPAGMFNEAEISKATCLIELGSRPYDVAVTFSNTGDRINIGGKIIPNEETSQSLMTFIDSLGASVVALDDSAMVEVDPVEVHASTGGTDEGKEKHELKEFFGDLLKQKKKKDKSKDKAEKKKDDE